MSGYNLKYYIGIRVATESEDLCQTVIEPTLDMWTREKNPNNMVINDPKGELLVKYYVRGTVRGFQIVQFNLINAMKTDIYNRVSRFVMKSYNII